MRRNVSQRSFTHMVTAILGVALSPFVGTAQQVASQPITFTTTDGAVIQGTLYGAGEHGVVLAHGGRFNKESWARQALILARAGYPVLAFDFRGHGKSTAPAQTAAPNPPFHLDVLAAVQQLKKRGVSKVSVVGGSFGGGAGADAMAASPGEIHRLVILGSGAGNTEPEKVRGTKYLILTRHDSSGSGPRLPGILREYNRMPQPKEMLILEGSAHAQYMFQTDLGDRVMNEILRFLAAK
jgi:pimeloyl-ACP methyl ester carboxylesterase